MRPLANLLTALTFLGVTVGVSECHPRFDGYDFDDHFVELDAGRMHYVDEGEGDPLVLLHGVPTWSYEFREVIPELSEHARVIAPDMLNHGLSEKVPDHLGFLDHYGDFEDFVDELGLERFTLVVADWSSPIGFLYAVRHPERVRGIVFYEAMLGPAPDLSGFPPAVLAMRGPDGEAMVLDDNFFFEQMLPQLVISPLTAEEDEAYRYPFEDRDSRYQLLQWPREIPVVGEDSPNLPAFGEYAVALPTLAIPKLALTGEPGLLGTPEAIAYIETFENLEIQSIGAAVHLFAEEQPAAFSAAVTTWFDGLPD